MGKLMFGWDEEIECIQPVTIKGKEGEPLCLAYKTSKLFIGAGVYLRDDGYVLRVASAQTRYYPLPDAAQVKAWQTAGDLPDPLPGYSIPLVQYVFGYSLWLVIVLVALRRRLPEGDVTNDALLTARPSSTRGSSKDSSALASCWCSRSP